MEREIKRLMPDHPRYWITSQGEVINKEYQKYLTPEIVDGGYLRIRIDGKRYYIHRLVAEYFIDNPENKKYVVHLDGNHANNSVDNLAWSNGFKMEL